MPTFDAEIEEAARGGAVVGVPDEVVAALGGGGRIPVRATFDSVPYRGSVVRMGAGRSSGSRRRSAPRSGRVPATASGCISNATATNAR